MCGRLNVTSDPLARIFVLLTGEGYPGGTDHNVAPTETVWVVVEPPAQPRARMAEDGTLTQVDAQAHPGLARPMRWWLVPYWSDDEKPKYAMFNARADNLEKSRAFRGPFERRRCVVPVTGFYEWLREGKRKLPQHVQAADGEALLLAGVWDRWARGDSVVESFAIVTTAVHPELAFLHDRQPVLLDADEARRWIASSTPKEDLRALLDPALPVALQVTPVSEYVNNARHKGDDCAIATGNPQFLPAAPRLLH